MGTASLCHPASSLLLLGHRDPIAKSSNVPLALMLPILSVQLSITPTFRKLVSCHLRQHASGFSFLTFLFRLCCERLCQGLSHTCFRPRSALSLCRVCLHPSHPLSSHCPLTVESLQPWPSAAGCTFLHGCPKAAPHSTRSKPSLPLKLKKKTL